MNNLKFIKKLIKYEISLEEDVFCKEDVINKYLYGKCDYLVQLLFALNDMSGDRIEIRDEYETIHYVYKDSEDDCYYDINGKHEDIHDLIINTELFQSDPYGMNSSIKIRNIMFSDYTLSNMDLIEVDLLSIKGDIK